MKHTHSIALFMALLAGTFLPCSTAVASSSCEDLVTACFVSSPEDRDTCIQTASAASVCETSTIHTLVAKRAQFATIKQLPLEGPAFLGPQIVDRRCLEHFDTTWSAALVKGSLSQKSVTSLSAALDECAQADAPAMPQL
ncbi:MAG: hypothetical protein RL518_1533 [Pseudomonadota bacterium]|jgi:hypothetical protein